MIWATCPPTQARARATRAMEKSRCSTTPSQANHCRELETAQYGQPRAQCAGQFTSSAVQQLAVRSRPQLFVHSALSAWWP